MTATAAVVPPPSSLPRLGASALAVPPAPATKTTALRDMYGFLVKPEFRSLYQRFAPIYAAEEEERSARWAEYLEELEAVCGRHVCAYYSVLGCSHASAPYSLYIYRLAAPAVCLGCR